MVESRARAYSHARTNSSSSSASSQPLPSPTNAVAFSKPALSRPSAPFAYPSDDGTGQSDSNSLNNSMYGSFSASEAAAMAAVRNERTGSISSSGTQSINSSPQLAHRASFGTLPTIPAAQQAPTTPILPAPPGPSTPGTPGTPGSGSVTYSPTYDGRGVSNVHISSARDRRDSRDGTSSSGGGSIFHIPHHSSSSNLSGRLSNVAVSAAAFASKPKESALSKAKMFARQATKPHQSMNGGGGLSSSASIPNLGPREPSSPSISKRKGIDLTIQTKQLPPQRPSISERSPLARSSKELDRIASIGAAAAIGTFSRDDAASIFDSVGTSGVTGGGGGGNGSGGGSGSTNGTKKQHKHHLPSFRGRKEASASTVLSSSSSNSKLISDQGSIYSFHPSSTALSALEMKNFGTKEDRDQLSEDAWALICSKIMPLFNGDSLRVPVEDLNNLVVVHVDLLIHQGGKARDIMAEFETILKVGSLNMVDQKALAQTPDSQLVPAVATVWYKFFTQVLPYLEAVFLPLQLEFVGAGQILSPDESAEFWDSVTPKNRPLTTRRMILKAFRDHIIIPIVDRLTGGLTINFDQAGDSSSTAARILQCTNILAEMQSGDDNQRKIDNLVKALKSSWITMPRTGKGRRGFVLNRSNSVVT